MNGLLWLTAVGKWVAVATLNVTAADGFIPADTVGRGGSAIVCRSGAVSGGADDAAGDWVCYLVRDGYCHCPAAAYFIYFHQKLDFTPQHGMVYYWWCI